MKIFRISLLAVFTTVLVYTFIVGNNEGWNFIPIFFGDITEINWTGQFNLDFSFFLILTGFWIVWRNQFKPLGYVLGLLTLIGGIPYVSIYLFYLSLKSNNINSVLIGNNKG